MSTLTVREQGTAERKRRVVEAALLLAAKGGYESVQMRGVAAAADVALGTIYRYFSSKDELLLAGLAGWSKRTRRRLAEVDTSRLSAADRLGHAVQEAAKEGDRAPLLMKAFITAMASTDPAVSRYKLDINRSISGIIRDALGDDVSGIDVASIEWMIGHVWFSATARWVSGMSKSGSVGLELRRAVELLLPRDSQTVIDLHDSGSGLKSSKAAGAATAGLKR
ncbi:MAG: TetR family transcriptional regulator [Acidimicrobiales bacterium]